MNRFLEKFKEIPRGVRLGTIYTVEWATAVQDAIRALAQGENITLDRDMVRGYGDGKISLGVRRKRKAWGTAAVTGPFHKVYRSPDGLSWLLLGGTVTGGTGTETVDSIDIGTIATPPASGTYYWLEATVDAIEEDDVLLTGCNLTAISTDSGLVVPDDVIPSVSSVAGTHYIPLGSWQDGVGFTPANLGNISLYHYPGMLAHQSTFYLYQEVPF